MPVFEFETPDGKYQVEAPDQDAAIAALGLSRPKPAVDVGEDMARSAASGLRSGVEGMLGQFGAANEMSGDAAAWLAGKMGAGQGFQDFARAAGRYVSPTAMLPSTSNIQAATNAAIGERYQPQTTAGKYVRTVAEFAPNAAAGPGSFARKAAMAVVPGLASETAGQLTEGTAAEPYARLVGGIAGGLASAGRNPSAVNLAARDAPSEAALGAQADKLYGALRDAGIRYDSDAFGNAVLKMALDLKKQGFRPVGKIKEAFDWVEHMAADVGKSPTFDDINSLRQAVGGAARDAYRSQDGKSLGTALDIVKDHLDDFEGAAPMISDKPMPKEQFDRIRKVARETALKRIKQRAIDEVVQNADTYQSGRDAGIRNGIGNLLRSKRGIQLFRGDERRALLDVQHNRKALRTLSRFGFDVEKLSGNATLIPTFGAGTAGGIAAGLGIPAPLVSGALVAAGTAAKFAGPRLTERSLNQASAAIRSGHLRSPQVRMSLKAARQQKLIRHLLTASSAVQAVR